MKKAVIAVVSAFFGLFLILSQTGAADSASYQVLAGDTGNAWSVMALRAAGQSTNANGLSADNLVSATDIERVILGAVAGYGDPYNFKSHNLVAELDAKRNNKQIGDAKLLNDDIFGILAYVAAGVPNGDSRIQDSKQYLLNNQNSDGGFAYATGFRSDSNMTAMALIALMRAGVNPQHATIQNALVYLHDLQNSDGGFGLSKGEPSDAGSTAWVISALQTAGLDANDWRESRDPYEFLETLLTGNGSYKWRATDASGQTTMTAYVVIAQSNASYPVAALPERQISNQPSQPAPSQPAPTQPTTSQPAPTQPSPVTTQPAPTPSQPTASANAPMIRYRIEGKNAQLCQGEAPARTAMDALAQAAAKCKFTYDTLAYQGNIGLYVNRIANDRAQGIEGWMYLINWKQPSQAADQYQLQPNDYVTWYYGHSSMESIKLWPITSEPNGAATKFTFNIETLEQDGWHPATGNVYVNGNLYEASPTTTINLTPGTYTIHAEKPGYIRGHVTILTVR